MNREEGSRDAETSARLGDTPREPTRSNSASARNRALLALLLVVPIPTIGTAASMFTWPSAAVGKAIFIGGKIWLVVLPVAWHVLVDRAKLSGSPARKGGFGVAALLGVAIATFITLAYVVVMQLGRLDPQTVADRASMTGLDNLEFYLWGAIYWITLNSLMEEYVWRWFVFSKFETVVGGRWAVIAAAAGFTLHHVVALAGQFGVAMTVFGSLGVFVGGCCWSWLYLRYRSIWPCYVSHAIVDIPIFVIGYLLIFRS